MEAVVKAIPYGEDGDEILVQACVESVGVVAVVRVPRLQVILVGFSYNGCTVDEYLCVGTRGW